MSRWVRGIYNSAANFVLSGSLRSASGRTLDRRSEHLPKERNESNEHVKSGEPCKSVVCTPATCSCSGTTTNEHRIANKRSAAVYDAIERDYHEYLASINSQGKDASARVRTSDESRHLKQTSIGATTNVEYLTGIQPGVTV
jgi:hypothetical protein